MSRRAAILFMLVVLVGASAAHAFHLSPDKRRKATVTLRPLSRSIDVDGPGQDQPEPNEPLRQAIHNLVSSIDEPTRQPQGTDQSSVVHIIGTGLCPTLLNLPLSTLHVLSEADVVLYDSLGLSHRDICQVVPRHCEVVCVGKRGDKKSWKQSDIDALLLQKATESSIAGGKEMEASKAKSIVRLKGGDPFLFGRTRTEIESLRSNDISYTYTPGISSCIAGPHLGGIPLTDPSMDCQSFGVWSGTDAFGKSWGLDGDDTKSREKWQGLDVDVLVFLMIGRLDKLEALCRSIADDGGLGVERRKWSNDTPCAVIQNAGGRSRASDDSSIPIQRVWRSTLGSIVAAIKEDDESRTSVSPAVFVVGATAALDLLSQE